MLLTQNIDQYKQLHVVGGVGDVDVISMTSSLCSLLQQCLLVR